MLTISAVPALAASMADPRVIEIKFKDDTEVSAANDRIKLGNAAADQRLSAVIGARAVDDAAPVFTGSRTSLDTRRAKLVAAGKRAPDLTTFVRVRIAANQDPAAVLRKLKADPAVASAQAVPAFEVLATPDLSGYQTPLFGLLGISSASSAAGILGGNVNVTDVEYGFDDGHEEFAGSPAKVTRGTANFGSNVESFEHGTAELSIVGGRRDGKGIDGIAPSADSRFYTKSSVLGGLDPGQAVLDTADTYGRGDVIFLPIGAVLPGEHAPIEYLESVYAAIVYATGKGITVIEGAGNGSNDIGAGAAGTQLNARANSGAIIVGAGNPSTTCVSTQAARSKLDFSSYGARVDLQAPGKCVPTAGYGDLYGSNNGVIDHDDYRASFGGTSSATGLTAGVVAALSSHYEAINSQPLDGALLKRALIRGAAATPQQTGPHSGNIGPQINLKGSVDYLAALPNTFVSSGPGTYSTTNTPSFTFSNSTTGAAVVGYDCRVVSLDSPNDPAFAPCSGASSHTTAALADGDYRLEVRARTAAGDFDFSPAASAFSVIASPTTVTRTNNGLYQRIDVVASAGDANTVKVRSAGTLPTVFTIEDSATVKAGTGCVQVTSRNVTCTSGTVNYLAVSTNDLDDSIDVDVNVTTQLGGGSGNDTLRGVGSARDNFDGGANVDMVTYEGVTVPIKGTLDTVADDGPTSAPTLDYIESTIEGVTGGSASDTLSTTSAQPKTLRGSGGNDTLTAGPGGGVLHGGLGNDTITAGAGNDKLSYEGHSDDQWIDLPGNSATSYSGLGTDTLNGTFEQVVGGDGNDEIDDEPGSHLLRGGPGNDLFVSTGGDASSDTYDGGPGNDELMDGAGNDTLLGDSGNDIFRMSYGSGNDTVQGEDDFDEVDYSAETADVNVTRDGLADDGVQGLPAEMDNVGSDVEHITTGSGNDTVDAATGGTLALGGGTDTVTFADNASPVVTQAMFDDLAALSGDQPFVLLGAERVIGTAYDDEILGGYGTSGDRAFTFEGGAGNDTLLGGGNNDKLIGGPGIDMLDGGGGNDRLESKDTTAGDNLTCAGGTDSVLADTTDVLADAGSCESVTY